MVRKNDDALSKLLAAASHGILSDLVLKLAANQPSTRRKCLNFLKSHISLSKALDTESEGEIALALWYELEPDLSELDEYGGGEYVVEQQVADLLNDIKTQLDSRKIESHYRHEILEQVLPYIESGNAGMDDMLYEVAYSACYNDSDLRELAESFESMRGNWSSDHARRIYRRIGDDDKYLELRTQKMIYGGDYYDLATFFWESGQKKKALEVAENGLQKGTGRMDELRRFVADRAEESGNRTKYLSLQFDQASDGMTLEKYKAFEKMCTAAEWTQFQPQLLSKMKRAWELEQMKIHLYRKEYPEVLAILVKDPYPLSSWNVSELEKIAKKLEKRYPEEILQYYLSGLGSFNRNASRTTYARKADVMVKIRHLLVEVMGDEARWKKFAISVKRQNIKRPAFQDEFSKRLPDWSNFH